MGGFTLDMSKFRRKPFYSVDPGPGPLELPQLTAIPGSAEPVEPVNSGFDAIAQQYLNPDTSRLDALESQINQRPTRRQILLQDILPRAAAIGLGGAFGGLEGAAGAAQGVSGAMADQQSRADAERKRLQEEIDAERQKIDTQKKFGVGLSMDIAQAQQQQEAAQRKLASDIEMARLKREQDQSQFETTQERLNRPEQPLPPEVEAQRIRMTQASRTPSVDEQVMQDWIKQNPGKGPSDFLTWKQQQQKTLSSSEDDIDEAAAMIIRGEGEPDLTKYSFRDRTAIAARLSRAGYDQAAATRDWKAINKHLATLNGAQQERLRQAITFTYDSLDIIEDLYKQWQATGLPTGYKTYNRAALSAAKNLPGNAGAVASNLQAQINDLTAELGTVYKGGNASTDESLRLAAENLKAEWNQLTFEKALAQIRKNLQIRKNSIMTSSAAGVSPESPYQPTAGGGSSVPQVGGTFNGEKVLKVTRIE